MSFPLGDKLFCAPQNKSPDVIKLLAQMDNTTQEQRNHFGLLIIQYYYASGGTGDPFRSSKKSDLPYGIETNSNGKGCSLDPKLIPPILLNSFLAYLGI